MRSVKDIARNIRWSEYGVGKCDHYCKNVNKKCNFYDWFSFLDNQFIKKMCESCALREIWGYNYKSTKGYKKWVS